MDDFFSKIKKKLSVDNILDLMKDGKLKEEIKQTLTAGVNLNEKPKPEDFRSCLEVSSIENSTEEGQTKVHLIEISPKHDSGPSNTVPNILKPEIHVTVKNIYYKTAEGQYKLIEEKPEELFKAVNNLNETLTTVEKTRNTETIEQQKIPDKQMDLIMEDTNRQLDEKKPASMKSENGEVESIKMNMNVVLKTPKSQSPLENADKINFEMFLG